MGYPAAELAVPIALVGFLLVVLAILKPTLIAVVLIFLRPTLDYFSEDTIATIANVNVNVNALFILYTILVVMVLALRDNGVLPSRSVVFKLFTAFLLVTTLTSLLTVPEFSVSIAYIFRWTGILCFFMLGYILSMTRSDDYLNKIMYAVLASALIPVALAFWQVYSGTYYFYTAGIARVQGTFVHPGSFGVFCSMMLAISIPYCMYNRKHALMAVALSALLLIALVLSYFKTAWIGFLVCMLMIALFSKSRWKAYLLLLTLILISFLFSGEILRRVNDTTSWYWRLGTWEYLVSNIRSTWAMILGGGWGTTMELLKASAYVQTTAHDTYLELLIDVGVVGVSTFVLYHLIMIKYSYAIFRMNSPLYRQLGLSGIIIPVAFLVMYFTQTMTEPLLQIYFWLIFGLIAGLLGRNRIETSQTLQDIATASTT